MGRLHRYRPPPDEEHSQELLVDRKTHISHFSLHRGYMLQNQCRQLLEVYSIYPRGSSVEVMEWWKRLPRKVAAKVVTAGFGDFLSHLPVADRDRKLPVALAERWWDSTNSFHLPFGEMTLTPLDFTCITGVAVGGLPIPWDYNVRENANYINDQLGWVPAFASAGAIRVTDILSFYKDKAIDENDDVQLAHLTRAFFLYMLGRTLLSNTAETIHLCCLPALEDVDRIGDYNWGGAGMATLYRFMSAVSRRRTKSLGGYSFVWEAVSVHLQRWI
nr:protein MAIN-LIKE 2-like [Coffea arabica]